MSCRRSRGGARPFAEHVRTQVHAGNRAMRRRFDAASKLRRRAPAAPARGDLPEVAPIDACRRDDGVTPSAVRNVRSKVHRRILATRYHHCNSVSRIPSPDSAACTWGTMRTIEEIRLENLRLLVAQYGDAASLSRAVGKAAAQLSQWLNRTPSAETGLPRTIASKTAREIELKLQLPRGWFDNPREALDAASLTAQDQVVLARWRQLSSAEQRAFQAGLDAVVQPRKPQSTAAES